MKKLTVIFILTLLLLCSCGTAPDETEAVTEADAADTAVLFSAAGFERVYDEDLRATWICLPKTDEGLFLRILAYDGGDVSLRVICTDGDEISHSGKTYEIKDKDVYANEELLTVLRSVADGGDCTVGKRDITQKEREEMKLVLDLYDAAFGKPYGHETNSDPADESGTENGYRIYENDQYEIKYTYQFSKEYENGILTLSSGVDKPRTISIKHVDTAFSSAAAGEENVIKNVSSQGGELVSGIVKTSIGGRTAYTYTY